MPHYIGKSDIWTPEFALAVNFDYSLGPANCGKYSFRWKNYCLDLARAIEI